jgi:hypothetical protein
VPRSARPAGRPKDPLPPARAALTRQVRRLVDEAHLGNLREAAAHSGLAYGTVRDLYAGRTINPSIGTLTALGAAYALPAGWFTGEAPEATLQAGVTGVLPPDPEVGRGRQGRRILVPLAAWPLARLFLLLEPYLLSLPAGPQRPILAGAGDGDAARQRLTGFLLGPLLEAQGIGQMVLLGADPPFRGGERPSPERRRAWVETLRDLGRFWEGALAELVERAEAYRVRSGS